MFQTFASILIPIYVDILSLKELKSMNFLPQEILYEIFQYLEVRDLISLTTVCSAFNGSISGSKLSEKLTLNFRKLHGDSDSLGNRRYTKLKIGFYKPTFCNAIINECGMNFTNLTFKNCQLKIDIIRRILIATPRVTQLNFEQVKLSDVPNKIKKPYPNLSNLQLSCIRTDPRLYRILNDCNITGFNLGHNSNDNYGEFSDLEQLLNQQEQLKQWSINGFYKTSLFCNSALERVKFKLTSFSINDSMFSRIVHLKRFLEHQSISLQKIAINDVELCDFSTVINQLNKLRSISISKASMCYLEVSLSVQELNVEGQKIVGDIFSRFPALKNLALKWIRSQNIMQDISQHMKELEVVSISESCINGLELPSMKTLSLSAIDQCPVDFFVTNNRIVHLNLHNCIFLNDLILIIIAKYLHNLKSLNITDCGEISNESFLAIRENCKELCEIKIKGSTKNLNWKLLEKGNQLKIYLT